MDGNNSYDISWPPRKGMQHSLVTIVRLAMLGILNSVDELKNCICDSEKSWFEVGNGVESH
jgi:hypothetical protein